MSNYNYKKIQKKIIEIITDEDYNNYLEDEKDDNIWKPLVNEHSVIADFRPGKNIILCSLENGSGRNNLTMLSDFIKDRVDNGHGLPDKIYITFTSEPFLDMGGEKVFSNVVEKGFYVTSKYSDVPCYNENIECIFINSDLAIASNVKEYLKFNHLPMSPSAITTYGFPLGLLSRTRKRLTKLNANNKIANYNSIPTKHFICLNAVSKEHRAKLITWLHETNIIDKCHWSWLRRSPTREWDNFLENVDDINTAIFDFRKTKELDMSLEDLDTHINQDTVSDFYYLTDSLIDIGSESFATQPYQCISEKTWKPYLHGKVSFFFNNQSYYSILKNLGFELYDEIFDYSFDTIKDDDERLVGYYNELKRISEIPIEELRKKILSIEDKILRNRNHAWNCDLKTISPFKEYPTLLP
mgnify:FL=1